MTDRTVAVRLRLLVDQMQRDAAEAQKILDKTGTAAEDAGKKGSKSFSDLAAWVDKNSEHLNTLSTQLGLVGVGLTGFAALAVKKFADFDEAMSGVNAATMESAANMARLRQAALDAGAATQYSATESANAIETLAKAGVSTADILNGGLTGSLNLAAAAQMDVAEAAEDTATAMNQFGLSGKDASHISDLLAASAGKAMGDVSDMAGALKFVGPVAHQMGVSIEETAGTIAELAQQGILGEQAGTSLRGMLLSLTSPSQIAAKEMKNLGINVYDTATGAFVGFNGIAEQMKTKMADLTDAERDEAFGRIFGNEQVTAARILYAGGAAEVQKWTDAVNDSGYAAEQARIKTDNLKGDIERLGGSLDTVLIQTGSGANGVLREMAQSAESLVDKVGELPQPILTATLLIAGGGGLALLGTAGLLKLVTATSQGIVAMQKLGVVSEDTANRIGSRVGRATKVVAGLGTAFAAVQIASALIGTTIDDASLSVEELQARLDDLEQSGDNVASLFSDIKGSWLDKGFADASMNAIDDVDSFRQALDSLADPNFVQKAQTQLTKLVGLFDSTDLGQQAQRFSDYGDELKTLATSNLPVATAKFSALYKAAGNTEEGGRRLLAVMPDLKSALVGMADGAGLATDDATLLSIILGKVPSVTQTATAATDASTASMTAQAAATKESDDALTDWLAEVAKVDASFIDPLAAYDDLIQKNKDVAQATADATKKSSDSWEDYYDGQKFSLAEYLANLDKQVAAQQNWERNLILLSGRASQGVIDNLRSLGPEGAPLVQALLDGTDAQLEQFEQDMGQSSATATSNFANNLSGAGPVIAAAAAQLGSDAAAQIAQKLADGTTTIPDVLAEYGLVLEKNPLDVPLNTVLATGQLAGLLAKIDSAEGTVTVDGDMGPAAQVLSDATATIDAASGTITIYGDDGEAITTLTGATSQVDAAGGTITIRGNDAQGRATVATLTNWTDQQGASVKVGADTSQAMSALDSLMYQVGLRQARIGISSPAALAASKSLPGGYSGGRLPAFAPGGRLPGQSPTNPTVDNLLGVDDSGMPRVRVRSREWVVNEGAADFYGDAVLSAINAKAVPRSALDGLASGGALPASYRKNGFVQGMVSMGAQVRGLAAGGYVSPVSAAVPVSTAVAAAPVVVVPPPSLDGARLEGTLDLGNGLTGQMRAVVRAELDDRAHDVKYGRPA